MTSSLIVKVAAYKMMSHTSTVRRMRPEKLLNVNMRYRHFLLNLRQRDDRETT